MQALPEYIRMGLWNQLSGMLELFHALDELQDGIEDVPDHVSSIYTHFHTKSTFGNSTHIHIDFKYYYAPALRCKHMMI